MYEPVHVYLSWLGIRFWYLGLTEVLILYYGRSKSVYSIEFLFCFKSRKSRQRSTSNFIIMKNYINWSLTLLYFNYIFIFPRLCTTFCYLSLIRWIATWCEGEDNVFSDFCLFFLCAVSDSLSACTCFIWDLFMTFFPSDFQIYAQMSFKKISLQS